MPKIEWRNEGWECSPFPALDLALITSNGDASSGDDDASDDDASRNTCTCGDANPSPCDASPSAGGPIRDDGRGPSALLPA